MKKFLLTICVAGLSLGTLQAQKNNDEDKAKFAFGVKAGLNVSNVWDSEGQDFVADSKAGLAGGIFLGIPIGKFLGVQPEILISQKGLRGSGTLLGSSYSFKRTTTSIDLPLHLQVRPTEYLTLLAGPQLSYLMHEKNVYTFGSTSNVQEEEFNNDNIRRNILGFSGGADVFFDHFVLSGRLGMDFQTNHGDGTSSTPRYKNRWVQFTAGYKF